MFERSFHVVCSGFDRFIVVDKTCKRMTHMHLQAKKAQLVAKRDEDEWGTGELGEDLLPQ